MGNNLTGQLISATYQELVQISGSILTNGTGSDITNLTVTASNATTAASATSASFATTASYAENAAGVPLAVVSASISDATITYTRGNGSTFTNTVNNVVNANSASLAANATTASFALLANTASFALNFNPSATASYADNANSASFANFALTASYAQNASTPTLQVVLDAGDIATGSIDLLGGISATTFTGDLLGTASLATNAISASYAATSSLAANATFAETAATATNATNATNATSASFAANATSASQAVNSANTYVNVSAANVDYHVTFNTINAGYKQLLQETEGAQFTYNPSNNKLTVANIAATTLSGSTATVTSITASGIEVNNLVATSASIGYLQTVTGSATIIGDAFILLNTSDATRYAGILVEDSGSATPINYTASFFFDSLTNDWNYEYTSGSTDYGVALFGPTYSTKGTPTYLTANTIPKAEGTHHLIDSNISDNGTDVTIAANLAVASGSVLYVNTIEENTTNAGVAFLAGTAGFTFNTDVEVTGSINQRSGSFSGSVINNITDVYTTTAKVNHVVSITQAEYNAISASADPNTLYYITDAPSFVTSASYALSASHAEDADNSVSSSFSSTAVSASYSATATSASHAVNADSSVSASHAVNADSSVSASYALTASYAENSIPAFPFNGDAVISGSLTLTGSFSSEPVTVTAAAGTASVSGYTGSIFSVDATKGNFFNLTLTTSSLSVLDVVNMEEGQQIYVKVYQSASAGAEAASTNLQLNTNISTPNNARYIPSTAVGNIDQLSITNQNSTLLASFDKQFVSFSIAEGGFVSASGGTETTSGSFRIHTFTSTSNLVVHNGGNVEVMVVAGGGGGGGNSAGGGGAGGLIYSSSFTIPTTASLTATIGAGGSGGAGTTPGVTGSNGSNSVFYTLTATGGGGGGGYSQFATVPGNNGGSGGGGGSSESPTNPGGTGVAGQGFAGGAGAASYAGGGGGGASEVGADGVGGATDQGGAGGDGLQYNFTGTPTYYAGGGGGGSYSAFNAAGGLGGGGTGAQRNGSGQTAGTANTGGGGGGGGETDAGAAGGSGIIIVKYQYQA